MNILLIEPDRLLAQTYVAALQLDGHHVMHVVSAQGAVQAADETMPHVVVPELQLPRHNGVEFLYEFRSYREWLAIPVIVHSYVSPTELATAATLRDELGVIRVLYKPVTSLAALCETVRHAAVTQS